MSILRKCLLGAALAMSALPAIARASVAYSDNFESDTIGSAPAGWSKSSSSSFTISTVNDSTTGGLTNQAMDLTSTTTSTRYGTTPFTSTTLNPGDTIELDYDLWFVGTPPTGDRLFRYGLYNTNLTNSPGITGRIGTGTDASPTAFMDIYDSPKVFDVTTGDGAKQAGADKTDSGAVINDDLLRHITLTATLASDSSSLALSNKIYDGNGNLLGSTAGTDTTLNDSTFAFNDLAIGINSGASGEYRVDNVSITVASAPEPSSLALLALVPAILRRRCR